jgi:hypothetical protein
LIGKYRQSYIAIIEFDDMGGRLKYEKLSPNKETPLFYEGVLRDGTEIQIFSAGYDAENVCSIKLNGCEYAVKKRGLNFVIYDIASKTVIDMVAFDTFSDSKAYRFFAPYK